MAALQRPCSDSPAYRYLAVFKTSPKPFTRQRTIVVDPGDRWQLRQVRCIRQHLRKRHPDRKPCEENLIHSAVQPAVDWSGWHVVFEQLRVFGLIGALSLQRPPRDFRIHDKDGAFTGGVGNERVWGSWGRFRVEKQTAVAPRHLWFGRRCLEGI